MRPIAPLVLLLLAPVACSKKETLDTVGLADVQSFCAEWAGLACNDQVVKRCAAGTKDACVSAQQSFCETLVPDGQYSAMTAQTCLDAVKAAYADAVLTAEERDTVRMLAEPCDRIVSGSIGKGGECTEDGDCNRDVDLSCVKNAGAATGMCEKPTSVGGGISCAEPGLTCEDGFYCDGSHCVEAIGEGKGCTEGVPCQPEFQCLNGAGEPISVSADGGSESGTCQARKKVGDPCLTEADCLSRICAPRASSTTGVCAEEILLTPSEPICVDL